MMQHVHSDASYLSDPNYKRRLGGYFYLPNTSTKQNTHSPFHIESKIIQNIVTSSSEAELSALYHNSKLSYQLSHILTRLGHIQHNIHIKTDRKTSHGILTEHMKPKKFKFGL